MGKHRKEDNKDDKPVGCPSDLHGRTTISGGLDRYGRLIHLCSRCGGKVNF